MNGKYYTVREITTLKDMLESSAELYADNPAFLVKKKKGAPYSQIKYSQFLKDIEAMGTALINFGLKGKKVALIGDNCYEWVVSYYAVVNGTGVVVPLDKALSKAEIDNLIDTAECDAVIYSDSCSQYFADRSDLSVKIEMHFYGDRIGNDEELPDDLEGSVYQWKNVVGYGEKLLNSGDRQFSEAYVDPDEMRMLLFTSGTTGVAKGVMLCHRNLTSDIMDTCRIADIHTSDRTLSILPIHHTYESTLGIMLVNYRGASVSFCEGLKYVSKNMKEAGVTVFVAVPLILEGIYDKIWKQAKKTGKEKLLRRAIALNKKLKPVGIDISQKLFKTVYESFGGKLRLIITGAAAMSPVVLRGFEDLGIMILQGYGLTECSPLVSGTPDMESEMRYRKAGSVGPSVMSGEIKIIDKDEDGIGEIVFRGPNVMLGYYGLPEETDKVLKDGWFYTGDIGFLDKDEWLYITGRKKNVIVTRTGKNIYPEELEVYMSQCSYIAECMVYSSYHDGTETVAVQVIPDYANIESDFGPNLSDEDVEKLIKKEISELNQSMASYKRVRDIIIRKEDFVRTTTRKIKRSDNI